MTVVISRALGPDGRGLYFLLLVSASTLVALGKLGLEQANVYLLATRRVLPRSLAAQNALASLTAGVLFGSLLLLGPSVLAPLFQGVSAELLLLAAITVPITLHTQLTAGLQLLQQRVGWSFGAAVAGMVLQLAILSVLAILNWLTVATALATNLVGVVATWVVLLTPSDRGGRAAPRWDRELFGLTVRHSLPIHVGMLLLFLHFRLDAFLVMGISGASALGLYSLAVVLGETVLLATDSLSIALLPRQLSNSLKDAAAQAIRMSRLNILVGLLASALWLTTGWFLIPLVFGSDFSEAYQQVAALLPGMIAFGVQRLTGPVVLRAGQSALLIAINGAALLLNVALDLMLIPYLGGLGAAIGSSISYSISAALFVHWTMRQGSALKVSDLVPTLSDARILLELVANWRRILSSTAR